MATHSLEAARSRSLQLARLIALSLVLLGAACTSAVEPPDLGEPITPPALWRDYWREVWNRCGSILRIQPAYGFAELEFRSVAGTSIPWDGRTALGAWEGNRIYIAESMLDVPLVVRHEMLHAQLGQPGHPAVFGTCDSLAAGITAP